jgi:hypothetical protein
MKFTAKEALFLTALVREQNQTGCKGPAHDLLRRHAYPDAPKTGPGSLAFSYEAVPLTSLLLEECNDLQEIDDFLRKQEPLTNPEWPWPSAQEFRARLIEARAVWRDRQARRDGGLQAKSPAATLQRG